MAVLGNVAVVEILYPKVIDDLEKKSEIEERKVEPVIPIGTVFWTVGQCRTDKKALISRLTASRKTILIRNSRFILEGEDRGLSWISVSVDSCIRGFVDSLIRVFVYPWIR